MLVLIGFVVVMGCVLGGYVAMGGHLYVLWQPFELVIIGGAGVGAYIISNPKVILAQTGPAFKDAFKGAVFEKEDFVELLTMLYTVFKLIRSKGMLALEAHIENPQESNIFSNFPKFMHHEEAVVFFADYMRLLTMGSEDAHQMEALMDEEIEAHHEARHQIVSAIQTMSDGLPALGIVAAVLGVIKTMGAINQPPEILGKYIGGALVGTFLGVLLSYGMVGPIANLLKTLYAAEGKYYVCMKAGILAHMHGYAPAISIEYARKALDPAFRPTFYEVEQAVSNVSLAE